MGSLDAYFAKPLHVLLTAAAMLLLAGCTEGSSASDLRFTGEMPAQLTRSDLDRMQVQYTEEDGIVTEIKGAFVSYPVETGEDAFRALASVSELFGINDFGSEMRLVYSTDSTSACNYFFAQYVGDVPVAGIRTVLYADPGSHAVRRVHNRYLPDLEIDTVPKLTATDARKTAEEICKADAEGKPELLILIWRSTPTLVWYVETEGAAPSAVYLDAQSGEVVEAIYPADD